MHATPELEEFLLSRAFSNGNTITHFAAEGNLVSVFKVWKFHRSKLLQGQEILIFLVKVSSIAVNSDGSYVCFAGNVSKD